MKFPTGPPLAEEVPGLVESYLHLPQAVLLVRRGTRADMAFFELALFGNELRDAVVQLLVVHLAPPCSEPETMSKVPMSG